jgi:hypothetical protein
MIKKIKQWIDNLSMYVVVDGADSSVTLSKRLVKDMGVMDMCVQPKVIVFRIPEKQSYGFMVNPKIEQETQLCDIQYNEKYKTIGFESLCPTVSRILFDYNIPITSCKLSVKRYRTATGDIYYLICKPNGKHTW